MSLIDKKLSANCIKCQSFCGDTQFCDLCERNARYTITEMCKKYNLKWDRISQFLFELFLEIYKCSCFVNEHHRRVRTKSQTQSLQTDFSPLRNSRYVVMRNFASQMSLNYEFQSNNDDSTSRSSSEDGNYAVIDDNRDCFSNNSTRQIERRLQQQMSSGENSQSFNHLPIQPDTLPHYEFQHNTTTSHPLTDNNGLLQENFQLPESSAYPINSASQNQIQIPQETKMPDYPRVPPNSYVESYFPRTDSSTSNTGVLDAADIDIDALFDFDQSASFNLNQSTSSGIYIPSKSSSRKSSVIPSTPTPKPKISAPMTPQPQRRKYYPSASTRQSQRGDPRSLSDVTGPIGLEASRKNSDSSFFQSITRLWSKKRDFDPMSSTTSSADCGLLDSDLIIENVIRLYFKCRQKLLHSNTLKGAECLDIRMELYLKFKDLRIVLEGHYSDDYEKVSEAFTRIQILMIKLYQRTFPKQDIQMMRNISQYFIKKCVESAFRMRNFKRHKSELFKKMAKVLDREL